MADLEPRHYQFQPTAAYEAFLETMVIISGDSVPLILTCTECNDDVCAVEADDTLAVLIRTAVTHECEQ